MEELTKMAPDKRSVTPIELIQVNNGWFVRRTPGFLTDRTFVENEGWVFETFDSLREWMKKYYDV